MTAQRDNIRKIKLFLLLALGISWLTALIIFWTGGLQNSPELIPNMGITLALVPLVSMHMWGPAIIAHLTTRLITKESWESTSLKSVINMADRLVHPQPAGPGRDGAVFRAIPCHL